MARSFLSRLTGSLQDDDYDFPANNGQVALQGDSEERHAHIKTSSEEFAEEPSGELAVDIYQTQDSIVVKALIAGIQPTTVDISLTREMLTISGKREDDRESDSDNYFQRELYWGSFTRTILLPEEVDVDLAEASEKHGILIIRLPKIDKKREIKLKVRAR